MIPEGGSAPPGGEIQHKEGERDKDFHLELDDDDDDAGEDTEQADAAEVGRESNWAADAGAGEEGHDFDMEPLPEDEAGAEQGSSPEIVKAGGENGESPPVGGAGEGAEPAEVEKKVEMPAAAEEAEGAATADGVDEVDEGTVEHESEQAANAGAGEDVARAEAVSAAPPEEAIGDEKAGEGERDGQGEAGTSPPKAKLSDEQATPPRVRLSDEPLPSIEKPPASPTERVALDRMLAQHDDFKFDRAAEVSPLLLLFCLLPFAKAAAGACDAGWGVGCSGRAPCAPVCCIIATRVRVLHCYVTRVLLLCPITGSGSWSRVLSDCCVLCVIVAAQISCGVRVLVCLFCALCGPDMGLFWHACLSAEMHIYGFANVFIFIYLIYGPAYMFIGVRPCRRIH